MFSIFPHTKLQIFDKKNNVYINQTQVKLFKLRATQNLPSNVFKQTNRI